jgi:hypothetical protein
MLVGSCEQPMGPRSHSCFAESTPLRRWGVGREGIASADGIDQVRQILTSVSHAHSRCLCYYPALC